VLQKTFSKFEICRYDPFASAFLRGSDKTSEKKKYHDALKSQVVYKEVSLQQRRKDEQANILSF